MAVITNEVSWSRTRASALAVCPRRYYYQYYLKWDGWLEEAPAERALAYRLSQMTGLPRLAGIAVHETIRRMFGSVRSRRPLAMPAGDLAALIMRTIWINAKQQKWRGGPKVHPPVFELYYQDGVPREEIIRSGAIARAAVAAFANSDLFRRLSETDPATWLSVDDPLGANDGPTQVAGDVRVWCRPDFALRTGDRVTIYDWKTGAPRSEDDDQLLAYALHARHAWGYPAEKITCVAVYLTDTLVEKPLAVTQDALDGLLGRIRLDLARMFALDAVQSDQENFPMTPSPAACTWCSFQEMCPAVRRIPMHATGETSA